MPTIFPTSDLSPRNWQNMQTATDALKFLRFIASQALLQNIFFLWRPFLPDANDDMILELAFAANCHYIVTHNTKDFRGCEQLGIEVMTPGNFLAIVKKLSRHEPTDC